MSEEPRELAAALERRPQLPDGGWEGFVWYAVVGQSFARGDMLGLGRCPASSIGPAFTAVWHRDPDGRWTFLVDARPELACTRYFGHPSAHPAVDMISLTWTGPRHLVVAARHAGLVWSLEVATTAPTRIVSEVAGRLPEWWWRSGRALRVTEMVAGAALGLGRVRLRGHTPKGQRLRVHPRWLWRVVSARAAVHGRDLGAVRERGEQQRLGDFWIPARALFAVGASRFEATR